MLTHNSKSQINTESRLCYEEYPIFFIDLPDWYEGDPIVVGSITSVVNLENDSQVLLVNDILDPIVSVLAKVTFSHSTIEGNVYRFHFNRNDIGVPTFC